MSELLRLAKTRFSGTLKNRFAQSIKIDLVGGRFSFLDDVARILDLWENDGIMFHCNVNAQRFFVFKEKEPDSYYPRFNERSGYRFASKDLKNLIVKTLELDQSKRYHFFIVNETPDQKNGFFELIYIHK